MHLTSRERFRKIMNFEPVDRLPLIEVESYEGATLERWHREGLPEDKTVAEYLGLDTLEHLYPSLWPRPCCEREVLAEDDNYITVRDEQGLVTRSSKAMPGVLYAHLEHPIKGRRDWEEVKERLDPKDPARWGAQWGEEFFAARNAADHPVGLIIHPFFYRLGYYMMGTERFMLALHDDPEMIHDMFQTWAQFVMEVIEEATRRIRLDYVAIAEDLAYKHSTFISPAMYQQFWMPYQTPVVQFLRQQGVPVVSLWSSGDIRPILPQALTAGYNATWPLESMAGMHAVDLRAAYGRRLKLAGNIAIAALIKGKDAIRQEVETKVLPLVEEGGFIPTVDDMTPPEVPFEHYVYYVELLKEIR